ncbi:Clavaminate synthase-like [Globisporangium polare]
MTTREKKRKLGSARADCESSSTAVKSARNFGSSFVSSVQARAPAIESAFTLESVQARAGAVTASLLSGGDVDVDEVLRDAKVHFLTSDRASWVFHVPRWYRRVFSECSRAPSSADSTSIFSQQATSPLRYSQWLDEVWKLHPEHHDSIMMFGKAIPTPRFQQAYAVSYRFSGNTFEAQRVPEILQHCVAAMQQMVVNPETQASFLRGVLVNWYANGEHYIGPHSDSEGALFKHSPVFSLSLGATRRFVFAAKATKKWPSASSADANDSCEASQEAVARLELELQDGDLVVMGGTTQQTHKHALPKTKKCLDKRISITLRCFK